MTKQEEIREGIERIIKSNCLGVLEGEVKGASGNIMFYLDSQGVVIKLESEWDIGETDTHGIPCNPRCHNMERKRFKEAGYVVVEPLVET